MNERVPESELDEFLMQRELKAIQIRQQSSANTVITDIKNTGDSKAWGIQLGEFDSLLERRESGSLRGVGEAKLVKLEFIFGHEFGDHFEDVYREWMIYKR